MNNDHFFGLASPAATAPSFSSVGVADPEFAILSGPEAVVLSSFLGSGRGFLSPLTLKEGFSSTFFGSTGFSVNGVGAVSLGLSPFFSDEALAGVAGLAGGGLTLGAGEARLVTAGAGVGFRSDLTSAGLAGAGGVFAEGAKGPLGPRGG